jgi:hypothetical protein
MTNVFNGIGKFCQAFFPYIQKLGNVPNVFFIIVVSVSIILWVRRMAQYNKEAEQNGTLK